MEERQKLKLVSQELIAVLSSEKGTQSIPKGGGKGVGLELVPKFVLQLVPSDGLQRGGGTRVCRSEEREQLPQDAL